MSRSAKCGKLCPEGTRTQRAHVPRGHTYPEGSGVLMGDVKIKSTPYDDVFRTLLNDCSRLIIPVINEVFGEHYSGDEKIIFSPNEHFLNRQGGNEEERITDTGFKIQGEETKKYHLGCQSSMGNSMLVRFFEYDALSRIQDKASYAEKRVIPNFFIYIKSHAAYLLYNSG